MLDQYKISCQGENKNILLCGIDDQNTDYVFASRLNIKNYGVQPI